MLVQYRLGSPVALRWFRVATRSPKVVISVVDFRALLCCIPSVNRHQRSCLSCPGRPLTDWILLLFSLVLGVHTTSVANTNVRSRFIFCGMGVAYMAIVCDMFVATITVHKTPAWVAARAKPHIHVFVVLGRVSIGCTGSDRWNGYISMSTSLHHLSGPRGFLCVRLRNSWFEQNKAAFGISFAKYALGVRDGNPRKTMGDMENVF